MGSSKSQMEIIKEPQIVNTNNDIFEKYLSIKESDCIKTNMQLFDNKTDTDYTHIVDIAACVECVKGKPEDVRFIVSDLAVTLDCITCKRVGEQFILRKWNYKMYRFNWPF